MAERDINAHEAISTHAPLRGATLKRFSCPHAVCISTHAPLRGATAPAKTREGEI